MDAATFSKFWDWVSATVNTQSQSGSGRLDELPPPPEEIKIVH